MEYIGFAAGAISIFSLFLEIRQALKTRRLKDVAWGMLALMFCSSLLWNIYAFANRVLPLLISSSIHMVLQITLISLKFIYERKNRAVLAMNAESAEE